MYENLPLQLETSGCQSGVVPLQKDPHAVVVDPHRHNLKLPRNLRAPGFRREFP